MNTTDLNVAKAGFPGLAHARAQGRPAIMGIVNVTPDSFSDGGEAYGLDAALQHARRLAEEGADILDVGGESTRPGAEPVGEAEELARVIPVIKVLAAEGHVVSVDTRKAAVMRAAAKAGALIINDVAALREPGAMAAAADCGLPVILMHMLGEPGTMQNDPRYDDVVADVVAFLSARAAACMAAGIPKEKIALDPGIGFGKTLDHNLALIGNLSELKATGHPILLGASRKSFIAKLDPGAGPDDRLGGSLAAALSGLAQGVDILRVHDVQATRQAILVTKSI